MERRDDGKPGPAVQAAGAKPDASRLRIPTVPTTFAWSRRWCLAAGLLLIVILVTVLVPSRPARLTDKDTLVLAEIANKTGDPVFDDALRQGLSSQLEQSPFLNLLSDERIAQTLSLMAQPKTPA